MRTVATARADAKDSVALRVTRRAHVVPEVARQAFADLGWLGRPVDAELAEGWRQIATDLELPVRDGSGPAVRKAALIDIGPVLEMGDGLDILVAWRSASLTPLFPVFAGQLEITRLGLVLAGWYAPPLGRVGLLLDEGLMHFVATRTGQAFLASVLRECRERSVDI